MKGIFEKGSPRSSKVRIPTILMMLKSKDPQGRNHPKHRAQLLQLQPGSCPSRRPRQSWQQVGKIIFNQRLCQIIERLTRISSPGEWDFYDESLSSPRSRLSLKPARNNILITLLDDSLQEYGLLVRMCCMRGKPFHQRDIVSSQEPCFLGCQCHNSWNRRIE